MSTKSNNNAAAAGQRDRMVEGGTLASDIGILQRAGMELAYFSGYARLKQRASGGAGVMLRFERVRPRHARRVPAESRPAKSRRNFSTGRSVR